MNGLGPMLSRPVYKERVWGGRRLADLFGKDLPADTPIGESWEVADIPEGASSIANGPFAGRDLTAVTQELGADLVGTGWTDLAYPDRFPLLVKLLDAQQNLSVQVHPSQEDCDRFFPDAHPKDESWVILDAEAQAKVYQDFQPNVTPDDVARHLEDDTLMDLLGVISVRGGDVLRNAPGTVHALGEGVCLLEVQQPSDTTFRLYDYGRGRPIHVEEGKRSIRIHNEAVGLLRADLERFDWGTREVLVDVPAYRLERLSVTGPLTWTIDPRSVQVVSMIDGGGTFRAEAGEPLTAKLGQTILLPAKLGRITFEPVGLRTGLVVAGAGGVSLVDAG